MWRPSEPKPRLSPFPPHQYLSRWVLNHMVSIGRRVQEAIDYMNKGEIGLALTAACIALDVTSQRYAGTSRSSRKVYKQFVKDYLWLITYIGFPGLMATTVRVPFTHPDITPDASRTVGVEDIIYHIIRCSLVHSDEKATKVVWNKVIALGLDQNGNLVLSESLLWGLLGAVILSPVNKAEKLPDNYWFSIAGFKMFISELWGRIDIAKRVIKINTGIDVP